MARKKIDYPGTVQEPEDHSRCAWVDGAARCERAGSLSDKLSGGGPWYCREHYDLMKDLAANRNRA